MEFDGAHLTDFGSTRGRVVPAHPKQTHRRIDRVAGAALADRTATPNDEE
jgi:hypothetical protein